jgi:hypothetical protein
MTTSAVAPSRGAGSDIVFRVAVTHAAKSAESVLFASFTEITRPSEPRVTVNSASPVPSRSLQRASFAT